MKVKILLGTLVITISGFVAYKIFISPSVPQKSLVNKTVLQRLPRKDASKINTKHLLPGLTPPTNKWFSGIALQETPRTVFPGPLSIKTTEATFSVGLPRVQTTTDTIRSIVDQYMDITPIGADRYLVTRYDEVSVDITYYQAQRQLGVLTIAQGSPYAFFTALDSIEINISETFRRAEKLDELRADTQSATYIARLFNGATAVVDMQNIIQMPKGSFISMYGLPKSESGDPLAEYAGNKVEQYTVSFSREGESYQTNIIAKSTNGLPTLFGYMEHHDSGVEPITIYDTLYGKLRVGKGNSFSFRSSVVNISDSLRLGDLSDEERNLLVNTLRQDVNATKYSADDTYFAGKELYRSAQLLQLAEQLGQKDSADSIRTKLEDQLALWFGENPGQGSKYFYYDERMNSIVGVAPSFGSDEINDHHFHYAYFIYAASIVAKYDPEFVEKYGDLVDLLVADIANYDNSDTLPIRRAYDPYRTHSWASGSSPFDDGNNQESSSEAINAWVATSLWASVVENKMLAEQSGWMLSGEVSAAKSYWLGIDTSKEPYSGGYKHGIVSLNWSGKRDYLTFFSDEPSAKFGIQLIPMNPSQLTILSGDPSQMQQILTGAQQIKNAPMFADMLLMYKALFVSDTVLDEAKALPNEAIDSVNSRTYMYAWILSQKQQYY